MINKITHIKHLSRFKIFSSISDAISLGRVSLFYAPNGRGKSTVADIISSFILKDPDIVKKRASKVYPGDIEISVNYEDGTKTARFTGDDWSNSQEDAGNCLIFNKDFIQRNIHTVTVEHEHKKKLHGLIVGQAALEAKEEVAKKRKIHEDLKKDQRNINSEFTRLGLDHLSLDEFAKIKPGDIKTLKKDISVLQSKLKALGNPEEIKAKPTLKTLPGVVINLQDLQNACTDTVSGGSKEAVKLLEDHIKNHINGSSGDVKEFIVAAVNAQGDKKTTSCALCGQNFSDDAKKVVAAMFSIFSLSYINLRKSINAQIQSLESTKSKELTERVQEIIDANKTKKEDWKKYIGEIDDLTIEDLEELAKELEAYKQKIKSRLSEKLEDTSIVITEELSNFKNSIDAFNEKLSRYNLITEKINRDIQSYKDGLDITKKQEINRDIVNINSILERTSEEGEKLSVRITKNAENLKEADKKYKQALLDFGQAQKAIIDEHKQVINEVLEYCGAKFRIDDLQQGTRTLSTEPYIEYSIALKGGETDAQLSAPDGLSDVLSEGEKNLLAFAFFWSLVNHHNLSDITVIFDDPLSSIDKQWRICLAEKLRELHSKGLDQLFVMTHYEDFAQIVSRIVPDVRELTIADKGATLGHFIESVNIEDIVRNEQHARIKMLEKYINEPTSERPEHIQKEIRNTLESALKHKYYQKLQTIIDNGTGWLRTYIEDAGVKPLLQANGSYETLSNLCTAGGWGNHDNPPSTIFDQDTAKIYAERTLEIIEKI